MDSLWSSSVLVVVLNVEEEEGKEEISGGTSPSAETCERLIAVHTQPHPIIGEDSARRRVGSSVDEGAFASSRLQASTTSARQLGCSGHLQSGAPATTHESDFEGGGRGISTTTSTEDDHKGSIDQDIGDLEGLQQFKEGYTASYVREASPSAVELEEDVDMTFVGTDEPCETTMVQVGTWSHPTSIVH